MNIFTKNLNIKFIFKKDNITSYIFTHFIDDYGIFIPETKYNNRSKDFIVDKNNKLDIYINNKKYIINNLDNYIRIYIYNFKNYIIDYIDRIYIKTINGRFGNKLMQYNNSIAFALKYNINIVEFEEPFFSMKNKRIILGNYNKKKKGFIRKYFVTWYDIFYPYKKNKIITFQQDIDLYGNQYINIMNNYIKKNLSLNFSYNNKNYLTIHIRVGDKIEFPYINYKNYHTGSSRLPLKYYIYIIKEYNFDNILIITDEKNAEIINNLSDYCKKNNINIKVQSTTLKNDIEKIIESKHLVLGKSTFSILLSCFLHKDSYIYIPSMPKDNYVFCEKLFQNKNKNKLKYINLDKII